MDLYINSYGCDLEVKEGLFCVMSEDDEKTISAELVESITITTSCTISTNAIALALENNIDIHIISKHGKPLGNFWHGDFPTTALIRRNQAIVSTQPIAVHYAAKWVWEKFDRQISLLKNTSAFLPEHQTKLNADIDWCTAHSKEEQLHHIIQSAHPGNSLRLHEAHFQKRYYVGLAWLLPGKFSFESRSRQPALDPFNASVNYCYAILYQIVESALRRVGLDPYLGFHHTNDYQAKSFTYDFIEPYRPWADFVVIQAFRTEKLTADCFEHANGCFINERGKPTLINMFNDFMHEKVLLRKRKYTRKELIRKNASDMAKILLKLTPP